MKQTAVQEFALALMRAKAIKSSSTNDFIKSYVDALQMEKEQIISAHKTATMEAGFEHSADDWANQYYNQTFKST